MICFLDGDWLSAKKNNIRTGCVGDGWGLWTDESFRWNGDFGMKIKTKLEHGKLGTGEALGGG